MTIKIDNNNSIKAFVNVVGVSKDTPVDEANELILSFINELNAGNLNVTAFYNKEGKLVIGFK